MTMPDPCDARAALEWLRTLGYRDTSRTNGWVELLVSRERERWIGRGADETAAIEDALAAMFPSHAARAALALMVSTAAKSAGAAPRIDTAGTKPPSAAAPPDSLEPMKALEPARTPPKALPRIELPQKIAPPPLPQRIAYSKPAPSLGSMEAIARLDDLDAQMQAPLREAPLWTPERQRMFVLMWLSRARQVQDEAGDVRAVHDRVYETASRIQRLSKIWWPGSVAALRIDATPPDCARDLTPAPGQSERTLFDGLRTWSDVADTAERVFSEDEARDESEGCDEHGWADAEMLTPAPNDAGQRLNELRAKLEKLTGEILLPKELADANELQPRLFYEALVGTSRVTDPGLWGTLAQTVRWLRGAPVDIELWGAVVGRLRWAADNGGLPDPCRARLDEILAPRYSPPRPWAQILNYDANKRERQQKRKEILRRSPQIALEPTSDAVLAWVREAAGSGFIETDELAKELESFREIVLSIDPSSFSAERRERNKIRAVQSVLRGEVANEETEQAGDATDESARRAAARSARAEQLIQKLLPFTRGKRALVIGNRKDPQNDDKLREIFEFSDIDRLLVVPSQIESAAQRIANKSYDYVLTATGFQSHSTDKKIKDACRESGVRYVSVDRGRPQACVLHMARELGIE